ncbi:MAG: hypothetical protein IIV02_00065, partial [Peptococcaceae bacterium]|nr:hypothetical protein [Peptococcaceae bacterium]
MNNTLLYEQLQLICCMIAVGALLFVLMDIVNEIKLTMDSRSINEGFSRVAVSAFIASADPNIEEITDIKTAV